MIAFIAFWVIILLYILYKDDEFKMGTLEKLKKKEIKELLKMATGIPIEGKMCRNCKYGKQISSDEPCKTCWASYSSKSKWKPREEGEPKEVQEVPEVVQEGPKNISCGSCKYQFRPPETDPCFSCNNGWVGRTENKWEPMEQPEEIQKEQEDEPKGSAANSEHYMMQVVQSIEVMQMVMSYEKFLGFLEGNIIKYSMRCGLKDDPKQEKTKIKQYKMWLDMARVGKIIDPRVHVYKEGDNKNE